MVCRWFHRRWLAPICLAWSVAALAIALPDAQAADAPRGKGLARPRARELGIRIGVLAPGPHNGITDVEGVLVGHCTIVAGEAVRTGVTAILPHGGNLFQEKIPAAIVVGNGFGKLVGKTQVDELGLLETPIVLTNTLSVFTAADAVVQYSLGQPGNEDVRSINPVAGETNDGYVNDIRAQSVRAEHVFEAIRSASTGPVEEGSVGAGTGTRCFGFKGGIGTASRRLPESAGGYTLGALVQSNFGGMLAVAGAPVGRELGGELLGDAEKAAASLGGSCMIVLAVDAPLDARQLQRVARRALLGLAAIGSPMSHGSGDYVIAFSTAPEVRMTAGDGQPLVSQKTLRDSLLTPLFQAARDATEEAILNSLLRAAAVQGFRQRRIEAIPIDRLVEICRRYNVIRPQTP